MIFSFANNKGGVGKTTSALNIGIGLANKKKKVLFIDMDAQTNLTTGLGIYEISKYSIYDVLIGECDIKSAIVTKNKYIDILPSTIDLNVLEFDSGVTSKIALKNALEPICEAYNYIVIDTPPGFGHLSLESLQAADKVFIPVLADFFSYQGLSQFVAVLKQINKNIEIGGIILTHFDKRKVISRDIATGIKERFGEYLFDTYIRENVAISEALAQGKDIYSYNPKSNGALDYEAIVKTILKKYKS